MTNNDSGVSPVSALMTIIAAALGFSVLALFAINGFVNAIYDSGRPATETHGAAAPEKPAAQDEKPASPSQPEAPAKPAEPTAEPKLSLGALLAAGDAAKGEKVAKKCVACHTFEKDGANKVGPNLFGVLGRNIATKDGFAYSPAMTGYAGTAGTWKYENITSYLRKPKKVVPKTKMAFAGLKKDKDLANMIAYLRQHSDNPPPLPSP
jgi:cytochrome c